MGGEEITAVKRPVRRKRWIRWGATVILSGVVGIVLGAWVAYLYRVDLANRMLTYVGSYEVTVGTLEVRTSGKLDATDVLVKNRRTGLELLKLPEVTVEPGWSELLAGRVGEIVLKKPILSVDEAQLQEWMAPAKDGLPDEAEAGGATPFYIGAIKIENGTVRLHLKEQATLDLSLDYEGELLTRDAEGVLSSGVQELKIKGGRVNATADAAAKRPLELAGIDVKGHIEQGWLNLTKAELDGLHLYLTPQVMEWLKPAGSIALERVNAEVAEPREVRAARPVLRGVRVEKLMVKNLAWEVAGFLGEAGKGLQWRLPDSQGLLEMDVTKAEFDFQALEKSRIGSQQWALQDVAVEVPNDGGHVRLPMMALEVEAMKEAQRWKVKDVILESPDVRWTSALQKAFSFADADADADAGAKKTEAMAGDAASEAEVTPGWEVLIEEGSLQDGKLHLADEGLMAFQLETKLWLQLKQLAIGSFGWRSREAQTLTVQGGRLQFRSEAGQAEKKPFFELPYGKLEMTPDRWNANRHVQMLDLRQPLLRMRDGNTPWLAAAPADAEKKEEEAVAAEAAEQKPTATSWWQELHFDELTLEGGTSDLLVPAPKPVEARGSINILTNHEPGGPVHEVRLGNVEARLPTLSRLPFPVAKFEIFEARVRLPELWTERRIDSVKLEGANLEAGEALMSLVEEDEKGEDSAEKAADEMQAEEQKKKAEVLKLEPKGKPWMVGQLDVTRSSVTIVNLVPGLPAVKFNLEFHASDSPLMAEDLTRHLTPQRVELARLTIPSPYEPLRPVAELDSIFVYFTLQGLMNKQIDKIEIVSPTLYVGEDLFWYVDYYRQYVSKNAKTPPDGPEMVNADEAVALKAASALIDAEPSPAEAGWSIKQLQIHSGKLILAPKGKPLKGFGKPLPFNINTEVVRGTLEAELQIPSDVYTLEEYKLELDGMHGTVHFNLPLKQKDNNLVETFEVERIRWKELQTGKAFLSITYDAGGIYAKFGAEAYEGYVNGEVNVYNDDSYSWDGWIGGKKVQTKDLTAKLFPTYFFMQGDVEATLVAQGNMHELFQADGSFKNHSAGKFSITALNDAVKRLPGDWTQLEKQLTQIGLETLRDFEYDDANAQFRLYGREGKGQVRFSGAGGSRNFDINVYDHRWTAEVPSLTSPSTE